MHRMKDKANTKSIQLNNTIRIKKKFYIKGAFYWLNQVEKN